MSAAVRLEIAVTPCVVCELAERLCCRARQLGFRVVAMKASRIASSRSKYLYLSDTSGRLWIVRVAGHFAPLKTWHDRPHYDVITRGNPHTFEIASAQLARMAAGEIPWWRTKRTPMRQGQRP